MKRVKAKFSIAFLGVLKIIHCEKSGDEIIKCVILSNQSNLCQNTLYTNDIPIRRLSFQVIRY